MQIRNYKLIKVDKKGFTLIELLVVISILGILLALSVFGMQGARQASRDGKRKADLEQIRSGVEMYKADCDSYPISFGENLTGDGSTPNCLVTNTYIGQVPVEPLYPNRDYVYSSNGQIYEMCAALEGGSGSVSCGSTSNCGGVTCNYKVTNP